LLKFSIYSPKSTFQTFFIPSEIFLKLSFIGAGTRAQALLSWMKFKPHYFTHVVFPNLTKTKLLLKIKPKTRFDENPER